MTARAAPHAFVESRPGAPEGLEFDWRTTASPSSGDGRDRGLADNTVDWLSMIFRWAVPPSGESYDLRVYATAPLHFRLRCWASRKSGPLGA